MKTNFYLWVLHPVAYLSDSLWCHQLCCDWRRHKESAKTNCLLLLCILWLIKMFLLVDGHYLPKITMIFILWTENASSDSDMKMKVKKFIWHVSQLNVILFNCCGVVINWNCVCKNLSDIYQQSQLRVFYWCYYISLYHNMFRPLRAIIKWIQYITFVF
jgi:hypothetical protein